MCEMFWKLPSYSLSLELGLLDDAITHTKDILQKGMANSKVLEYFFQKNALRF